MPGANDYAHAFSIRVTVNDRIILHLRENGVPFFNGVDIDLTQYIDDRVQKAISVAAKT